MLSPAKINLDLRITGRRADGYHLLDSIVVFADVGDELDATLSDHLSLEIDGPFGAGLSAGKDNLVFKAAQALCDVAGVEPNIHFNLTKNLPISSGIGGGSSNAAVALTLSNKLLKLKLSEEHLMHVALEIGADVPVCLEPQITHMSGIGEQLTPIRHELKQPALLVNPGISVSTAEIFSVFHNLEFSFSPERELQPNQVNWSLMLDHLKASTNDLQRPACTINTSVNDVLEALAKLEGVILSRMSGSGATCFALFKDQSMCEDAAKKLSKAHKNWWVKSTYIR